MGDRGFNAGGFAYMTWVKCPKCGRNYPLGRRRLDSGDYACQGKEQCEQRQAKKKWRR